MNRNDYTFQAAPIQRMTALKFRLIHNDCGGTVTTIFEGAQLADVNAAALRHKCPKLGTPETLDMIVF